MNIILDDKLKEYITENQITRIVLNNYHTKVCCGGASLPMVSFKEPDQSKGYYVYQIEDNLEIFIDETIEFKDERIVIKYRDYYLFKDFEVEGIRLL